jgi:hypothetical protein
MRVINSNSNMTDAGYARCQTVFDQVSATPALNGRWRCENPVVTGTLICEPCSRGRELLDHIWEQIEQDLGPEEDDDEGEEWKL